MLSAIYQEDVMLAGISEVGQSFLLKQQQTTQPQITNKIRHSLNTNCGRRPWR